MADFFSMAAAVGSASAAASAACRPFFCALLAFYSAYGRGRVELRPRSPMFEPPACLDVSRCGMPSLSLVDLFWARASACALVCAACAC